MADWNLPLLWSINPNLGLGLYEDGAGRQYTTFLLPIMFDYNITPHLTVIAEPALQTPEQRYGGASLIYDGGVTYIFGGNNQIDLNAGTGATGQTAPHPFLALGFSPRF